jgi:hypothetical protein
MTQTLAVLWENVPAYPPAPNQRAAERRTGELGRSLGSDESGGAFNEPSIYEVRSLGAAGAEGVFGTNLEYAPYVIGDATQAKQNRHWWKMRKLYEYSRKEVDNLWKEAEAAIASFLS